MQIQKVKTPALVQITFIAFFLVMMTPFLVFIASASTLDNYCERQFELSFMQKLLPVAKKCENIFQRKTQAWIS